ncbi:hypothetical protein [Actinoplanes couchii]|uniref:Uncharacterized protein n=1 Tax=Actinoplanes couchii TaxID=403638 RepID=A0ABQ3XJK6_9ACTN|nr:hypothetical protein [Actinoplanes couchii]MDR6324174.1 hypothetical protein [Actinoplanes couchii]GID58679.1 hypothetical protein Aco03nite_070830 [Actinoplanes couchii]
MGTAGAITARVLWERLVLVDDEGRRAWLDAHELLVDGAWRTFDAVTVLRHRGTPLLLYVNFPDGEHRVPMEQDIPVRDRA